MIKRKHLSPRQARRVRIRKKVHGTAERPRLTVYRSLKHVYAQLVDDTKGLSIAAVSTKTKSVAEQLEGMSGKVDPAKLVGKAIAETALSKNISSVVFDRNGYLYLGRIKALADAAREAGLQF